jgi:hypothetical protein
LGLRRIRRDVIAQISDREQQALNEIQYEMTTCGGVQHVCAAMRDQQRPINDNEDAKAVQLATAAMERLLNNAQGLVAQSG